MSVISSHVAFTFLSIPLLFSFLPDFVRSRRFAIGERY